MGICDWMVALTLDHMNIKVSPGFPGPVTP